MSFHSAMSLPLIYHLHFFLGSALFLFNFFFAKGSKLKHSYRSIPPGPLPLLTYEGRKRRLEEATLDSWVRWGSGVMQGNLDYSKMEMSRAGPLYCSPTPLDISRRLDRPLMSSERTPTCMGRWRRLLCQQCWTRSRMYR